ncbi:diguanylate cyclase DgcA [Spirochaeta thermophila]|uniref:diguanylate cyclase n=2 Tax=Winmispira thermophila TaxID=154 RepID=G0GBE6_WINT7|nr:diguanylate cyclase DgcA [Spirochaeta thermophila]ADN00994.1 hypothetical protein STHERM_c00180 [Spirochaeta thermophila DSM 6192]AEJ60305.1 diguanylate cyclase [Spirochaeta thermophila DSM 6578]
MEDSELTKEQLALYQKQLFDLRQLIEISKGLNTNLELETLIDSILYVCMGQLRVVKVGIFVRRGVGEHDFVLHRNYFGFDLVHDVEYRIPGEHPIISLLEKTSQPLTLEEMGRVISREEMERLPFYSLSIDLVVPLVAKGVLYGILILGDRIDGEPISQYEKRYLMDLAGIASIALHNAFLYEMAVTDFLTHLKLRNYFDSMLADLMLVVEREQTPLSLIMADLDHFKRLNDTYGHLAGDKVLQEIARVIHFHTRKNDIAARYGGEEFAVLLPHTPLEAAVGIADRIRIAVEHLEIPYGGAVMHITISLGVAQYDPRRDATPEDFIERADKALYMAKEKGRNRVCV